MRAPPGPAGDPDLGGSDRGDTDRRDTERLRQVLRGYRDFVDRTLTL